MSGGPEQYPESGAESGADGRPGPAPGPVPDGTAPRGRPGAEAPAAEAEAAPPGSAGAGALPPPEPWRRLSPRMMVTAPLVYLKNLIVPLVLVAVGATQNAWALASLFAALAGVGLTGVYTYVTVRYQVGAERLEIRTGLIGRSRRTVPIERIRGVHVTSTLVHRMLGLAVVRIEAAAGGSGDEEGKLDGVTRAEADRLHTELLRRRAELRGQPDGPAGSGAAGADAEAPPGASALGAAGAPGPAEPVVEYFRMPARWYGYAALSVGYLLTPFVAIAAVLGLASQVAGDVLGEAGAVAAGERAVVLARWLMDDAGLLVLAALAAAVAAVLLLAMPLFAVVSYAVAYWDFRLVGRDGSLVASRGLFTRQSVALERRRIRGYELSDSPLERLRSVARLRAVMTGLGGDPSRAVLLPAGPRGAVGPIADRSLGRFGGELQGHPRAALRRRLLRAVGPPLLVAAAAAAFGQIWLAVMAGAAAVAGVALGIDRYRALGHGTDGTRISVRSGSLQRTQTVVDADAVIGWRWEQSLFQRRAGLAHLTAAIGAGDGGCTAIDADAAESAEFAAGVAPRLLRPFLAEPPQGGAGATPASSIRT